MEHAACQHTAHQPHAGPLRHCWQPGAAEHCAETVPTDATTRMKEVMGDIGAEAPMSGVFSHTMVQLTTCYMYMCMYMHNMYMYMCMYMSVRKDRYERAFFDPRAFIERQTTSR